MGIDHVLVSAGIMRQWRATGYRAWCDCSKNGDGSELTMGIVVYSAVVKS